MASIPGLLVEQTRADKIVSMSRPDDWEAPRLYYIPNIAYWQVKYISTVKDNSMPHVNCVLADRSELDEKTLMTSEVWPLLMSTILFFRKPQNRVSRGSIHTQTHMRSTPQGSRYLIPWQLGSQVFFVVMVLKRQTYELRIFLFLMTRLYLIK